MPSFYAVPYTIHFDDTMAYGSHHFMTGFKFQCAAREAFLFGKEIFDVPGVREALDRIHLLTLDAYSRNLNSAMLGDRIALLLSLEEWGQASARFCYRAVDSQGKRICAGFQMLVCADAASRKSVILPAELRSAMDELRCIEEPVRDVSFRERTLAGGGALDEVFDEEICQLAVEYLTERNPTPGVISSKSVQRNPPPDPPLESAKRRQRGEVWVFVGQGGFDAELLKERIVLSRPAGVWYPELQNECIAIVLAEWGLDASDLFSNDIERIRTSVQQHPELAQIGIHLQNVLGGYLRLREQEATLGASQDQNDVLLMGHSFGELAAFTVAGSLDLQDSIRAVCLRSKAVSALAPPSAGLLAVLSTSETAQLVLSRFGRSRCVIAGRNHIEQCVLSGPLEELQALQQSLKEAGVQSTFIPSPTSFHHPDLAPASEYWEELLKQLRWREPHIPLFTPIGRRLIKPTENHAAVLASQLLHPFDFDGALADSAAAGFDTFVDIGSTGLIGKLVEKSNPGSWSVIRPNALAQGELRNAFVSPRLCDVSIVGMGCILPAGATSPVTLLQAIETQKLGLVDMREHDADWESDFYSATLTPDRSTSCLFGRVRDGDIVPPAGLDPVWFDQLSRTQRLLAIALFPCVAGLRGARRISCLIGATADGFEDQDEVASWLYAGISDPWGGALRNDKNLVLKTPHQAVQEVVDCLIGPGTQVTLIDAACASSLYSVSLGMNLLENDLADAVIAGGVFCPGPGNSCLFSQFKGTTSTGCRPFDKNSDGVVFSEGAAIITLRKQSDALKFGLDSFATIKAAGLSSDGRSGSANVPQSKGQILSLKRAYERYSLDPQSIAAIEGHGTSTPVGDSTEIETLHQFFEPLSVSKIPVHSLKGTLGHAGWAAGSASIIAATMYMETNRFPGQAFFRTPSDAVSKSEKTLQVSPEPTALGAKQLRIAINGFGFGGANAHLVLESPTKSKAEGLHSESSNRPPRAVEEEDFEAVIVAFHQIPMSEIESATGRFDRRRIDISRDFVVLPDLLEDMDISQKLAALLGKETFAKLPGVSNETRATTSIVLAMSDKTERGVEATFRVLYPRMLRTCSDTQQRQTLQSIYGASRPSGAYTLQCMMPNVASGRAALLLNTNGPNFVVDSGKESLRSAFECANLLLQCGVQGGTNLVLVEAIKANANGLANKQFPNAEQECAAVFAVTTSAYAKGMGWPVIEGLNRIVDTLHQAADGTLAEQVSVVVKKCESTKVQSPVTAPKEPVPKQSEYPIFTPLWVEKKLPRSLHATVGVGDRFAMASEALFIVRAKSELVHSLIGELAAVSQPTIVLVGQAARGLISTLSGEFPSISFVTIPMEDEGLANTCIDRELASKNTWSAFRQVVAIDEPDSWSLDEAVRCNGENELCETLFLILKKLHTQLSEKKVSVWQIAINSWNQCVHPRTGAIAGLLKSIRREYPGLHCGNLYFEGMTLGLALVRLVDELAANSEEAEICYRRNRRFVRRLTSVPGKDRQGVSLDLNSNSVVLATGGAKGVTAVMLQAIAEKYRSTIVAFGRSPLEQGPEDEAAAETAFYRSMFQELPKLSPVEMKRRFEAKRACWEANSAVESLRKQGSAVEYYVIDVTNASQVDAAIERVAVKHGRIDLVIHGAGVQYSKKLTDRTLNDYRRTYNTKVGGLSNLQSSVQRHVHCSVAFHPLTSAFSIFGNDGQHDYGSANETLDRTSEFARVHAGQNWFSIAWLAWDGVGMTRGSEYQVLAKQRGLSEMDAETGQAIFLAALTGKTAAAINVPMSASEHTEYGIQTVPTVKEPAQGQVYEFDLTSEDFPCLPDHLVRGIETVPGAWMLEAFVRSALSLQENADDIKSVILSETRFTRFVKPTHDREPNVRVVLEAEPDGLNAFLVINVRHSSGRLLQKDVVCARSRLRFSTASVNESVKEAKPSAPLPEESLRGLPVLSDPYCLAGAQVELSGEFDCIRDIRIGQQLRSASLHPTMLERWPSVVPATELDAAWRVGAMHASSDETLLFAPTSIESIWLPISSRSFSPAGYGWNIFSTAPEVDSGRAYWRQTDVCDATGQVQMRVFGAYAQALSS